MSPRREPSRRIVCECLQVTEADILAALRSGRIWDLTDLIAETQAGEGCTACHPLLREYLEKAGRKPPARCPAAASAGEVAAFAAD